MLRVVPRQTDYYKRVGRLIAEARELAGLSQYQLATIVGCTQPTMSAIERGARKYIDIQDVFRLVAVLPALSLEDFRVWVDPEQQLIAYLRGNPTQGDKPRAIRRKRMAWTVVDGRE